MLLILCAYLAPGILFPTRDKKFLEILLPNTMHASVITGSA